MEIVQPHHSKHHQKKSLMPPLFRSEAIEQRWTTACVKQCPGPQLPYSRMPLLLTMDEVCFYVGLSHSTVCEMLRPESLRFDKTFPKRIPSKTTAAIRFSAREVCEWVEAQIASRDGNNT